MMIYFFLFFRGKNPIEPGPAQKHSTHLHRKSQSFHTANSCKAVLETFHLPIVSIVHPKWREDRTFCLTAISFYFLHPCFFGVCRCPLPLYNPTWVDGRILDSLLWNKGSELNSDENPTSPSLWIPWIRNWWNLFLLSIRPVIIAVITINKRNWENLPALQ